ncbi:MAG: hypothetical protein ACJZ12_02535 [Candidatus Neomarinimicrobiota bacterium]
MKKLSISIFFLCFIFTSCIDRFEIPLDIESQNTSQFGAGDTTFLELSPQWDSSYGLDQPEEISVSQDGRIFVADKGNNSILVFDQNGNRPSGFELLSDLVDFDENLISPIDVDVDRKMNVFFIDGSQKIFNWNQYWNEIGINKISASATFLHIQTGVDTIAFAGTDIWFSLLNNGDWAISEGTMTTNQVLIDSLIQPHIFYDGEDEMNVYLDTYYQSDVSQFTGLTAPADDENMIFLTDNYGGQNNQYRIIQVDFKRSLILELKSGDLVWAYTGQFGGTVKGFGTGAGTVNQPLSIDVDYQGNLYYTQIGDYFPVHMIYPNLSGDFAVYTSGFQPEADDIMNPILFSNPVDIAVDQNKNIYVVDNIKAHVTVFDSKGAYFKKAGYEQDSLKIMVDPCAVAVDQRDILYVCDRGNGSIYRYQLSNVLDEDISLED